jgi:hypothetical protein
MVGHAAEGLPLAHRLLNKRKLARVDYTLGQRSTDRAIRQHANLNGIKLLGSGRVGRNAEEI